MKILILLLTIPVMASAYCSYYSKVGEFTPFGKNYKVCTYGSGFNEPVYLRWGKWESCPYSISYDTQNDYICGYN